MAWPKLLNMHIFMNVGSLGSRETLPMTVTMASRNRCTYVAGGDSNSSFVCRSTESESDVVATSDRAFLIGVAGGTASGKVIGSK